MEQGICNNEVGMASKDRVLENMVFLELSRRGYRIMVGNGIPKKWIPLL